VLHAKLRNRTCQGRDRQGQGQGQGLTSLTTNDNNKFSRAHIGEARSFAPKIGHKLLKVT